MRGGPEDPPGPLNASSSVERTFDEGQTYLFLPSRGRGDVFHDNVCSSTTVYRQALERLRPPGAHPPDVPPEPPEPPREGVSGVWWGAAAAVAAVAGAAAWRRRSAP